MADTPKVYVICDQNCKFESMTKEQILTAIMQAINSGTIENIDSGFIQTIKTINNVPLKFFVGSQTDYNVLSATDKENLFAIITDDTTKEDLTKTINELITEISDTKNSLQNLSRSMIAEVTIKPTNDAAIVRGGTFTFDLPSGKTFENIISIHIKKKDRALIGIPYIEPYFDGKKEKEVFAGCRPTTTYLETGKMVTEVMWLTFYSADGISFEGTLESATTGKIGKDTALEITSVENGSPVLMAGRDVYGDDYIKLLFY